MTLSLRSAALLAHPRSCARRAVRTTKVVEASRRAQMRIAAGELRATGRRHVPASPDPITGRQPVVERQQSATRRLCWVVARSQSLFEGIGLNSRSMSLSAAIIVEDVPARLSATVGGDRATRATSAPRIRRDLSLRKGSALEPQRLPRRRFLPGAPFNVTSAMKARSRVCIAVRNFVPILPRDDWLTTEQTRGERISDEAIANPGVDLLALVTGRGGLRGRGRTGASGSLASMADGSSAGSTSSPGAGSSPRVSACSISTAGSARAPSRQSPGSPP